MPTPPDFTAGTSLAAASLNKVGLWLVKTQTVGTGVTSVTVTNAFSADYDNYRVTYSGGTMNTSNQIYVRYGPQATQSEYYGVLIYSQTTIGTIQVAVDNNNTQHNWVGGANANNQAHVSVDIMGVSLAAYTKIRNGSYQDDNRYGTYNGEHRKATAYTDLIISTGGGSMTGGTIRVYGYRN